MFACCVCVCVRICAKTLVILHIYLQPLVRSAFLFLFFPTETFNVGLASSQPFRGRIRSSRIQSETQLLEGPSSAILPAH